MPERYHISPERLHTFFRPQSIALVGATDNSRWSLCTFENLKRFEFPGPVYLINPFRETAHGERTYKSLRDLPEPVDLAFIMVPTHSVFPIVQEAAAAGTRHFVVLTSGYSEVGVEGARLERELLAFAREHDLVLLGPNGNGFINVTSRVTPYGLPISPPLAAGPVGVVLQSGALASAVLAFAQAHAIGLSLLVSMGNESMISVTDVVDYLLEDESTRSIALFLESIRHPDELRRIAAKARARGKPIVALKIGRSETSARTALSHTGAIVGDDKVNDAIFHQLGIMRVHSLEDLLITAGLAGNIQPLPGRRMGIVTPSGGACDILSDLAQDEGITLPDFAPETLAQLQSILPPFSTPHNPLDVTGYIVVDGTLQSRALEAVVRDPNIDFIFNLVSIEGNRPLDPVALENHVALYQHLAEIVRGSPHPVVLVSNTCLDLTNTARTLVERTGLHFVAGLEHGMRAIGRLLWWAEAQRTSPGESFTQEPIALPPLSVPGRGTWSEARARVLLQQAGIPVVPGRLVTTLDEALQAAQELGFPLALKVQSAEIAHKSDVGGVALNINSEEALRQSYDTMHERVRSALPRAELEGFLISPMRSAGLELLVGVIRDPLWGPVLSLGLGGIWAEALQDTSVRVLPVNQEEIHSMLNELRGAALLRGSRGHHAVNLDALSQVIYHISLLAQNLGPELAALEINPLLVDATTIEALDVLLTWQEP
ncbi:acetyl-CoA synthetase [Ktedonobacter sp. SOSP1-85]|uniref:acetate--CoA ligase family protein n=1 Tax=Ktedonobacter sp. SOSP1-85 TaxID=2778367 RepID=UPI00191602EB|nr:acetate--CoA ligase family protein [Ktedonobacter sp. SOSP1-85]GHO77139.1 acetyl-CoA synthetase [Ktedonobacter sp. SOSP1-85]